MQCLIKDSEYWTKLSLSGLSELEFYHFTNNFVAKHGRYPNLDEIPKVDSSKHLTELIHLNEDSAKVSDILAATQSNNVLEANIILNDNYLDLEIDLFEITDTALVDINKRPSEYKIDNKEDIYENNNTPTNVVFYRIFDKLRRLYGIDLIPINSQQLDLWKDIPEVYNSSAFIYEGNIYVNTDFANLDAPIHELTHILLGSIKFKNPNLYLNLVSLSEKFENINYLRSLFPNKTYLDALEEIFVLETSKYLAGIPSLLDKLDQNILYEIHYNIKRLLDSALMGKYTVKSILNHELYNMSLNKLALVVQSSLMNTNHLGSLDDAKLHRMLSNKKSELLKNGDLKEECS